MQIHQLSSPKGARIPKVRRGRGPGSGLGKTSGRGHKGQRSRRGRGILTGLEGGQIPLIRRIPKVGFKSLDPKVYQIIHLDELEKMPANSVVNAEALKKAQLISSSRRSYKILSRGDIKKILTVHAHAFSKSAAEKIVKAGGKVEVIKPVLNADVKVKA